MTRHFAAFLVFVTGTAAPTLAAQGAITTVQEASAATDPQDTYGTATLTAEVVGAYECDPFNPAAPINPVAGTPNRTGGVMECPFMLPSGATIVSAELEACDTSATEQVAMDVANTTTPGGNGNLVFSVLTGGAATPGCTRIVVPAPAGLPAVNNATQKWFLQVTTGAATSFAAGRVLYRLNVSPAPATATFSDVPVGHPQMRFVEALVAAGITGGCGAGVYCPDAAVTRGQMAVFLSVALGLHFTP